MSNISIGDFPVTSGSTYIGDPPSYTSTDGTGDINIDDWNSGNIMYIPSSTSGNIYWPSSPNTYGGSTVVIRSGDNKYSVLELDEEDSVPISVYVCGRMVTLGIIGTDVECAYVGGRLIFEPGVIRSISYEGRITVSVEYKDEIHHYNVGKDSMISYKNNGNGPSLNATLVSKIQK